MKVLIKQAKIIASSSPHHGHLQDILIEDGIILRIGNISEEADIVVERPNLHVSLGWMDIFAHFNDPGYEQRETLLTGAAAAAAGGFTDAVSYTHLDVYKRQLQTSDAPCHNKGTIGSRDSICLLYTSRCV